MLKQIRKQLIQNLWANYRLQNIEITRIEEALNKLNIKNVALDHFAIIDLPGPNSSRANLCQIFSALGFIAQGCDYLPEKQNDFLWLTESDSLGTPATEVLPQVVVADFRPEAMPLNIRNIIEKYARQSSASPLADIQNLAGSAYLGNEQAAKQLVKICTHYLSDRDWPLPTINEFKTVSEFNELLAWVLVFGRKPNHFSYSVHLISEFESLNAFHQFIETHVGLELNHKAGAIKGSQATGIAQGSTNGIDEEIQLADGAISLPKTFMEFVWRYPQDGQTNPINWEDYFTGFVAKHANRVIESLYV